MNLVADKVKHIHNVDYNLFHGDLQQLEKIYI